MMFRLLTLLAFATATSVTLTEVSASSGPDVAPPPSAPDNSSAAHEQQAPAKEPEAPTVNFPSAAALTEKLLPPAEPADKPTSTPATTPSVPALPHNPTAPVATHERQTAVPHDDLNTATTPAVTAESPKAAQAAATAHPEPTTPAIAQPTPASHDAHATSPTPPAAHEPSAADKAAAAQGPQFSIHPPNEIKSATPDEVASLLRIGQSKIELGDYTSSELAFRQVLAEKATPEQDHAALMGLARTYRKKSEFTKATAVYETLIEQSPDDPLLPIVYLELGRTLRALGAFKPAIARFYSVINSTLKLPENNADNYRQLARTAQFEIAETYFQAGDYEQANRFFSRLKLLDLAPDDRARAHFKSIYALTLGGDHEKAVTGFRAYLDQNPNDENVPEARYLLSSSLRQLGRYNESLAVALELLRAEKKFVETDPKRWTYWQRKTGNQLANQFYEQGDFGSALVIYQNLANLSPELAWRLPVVYQIGLCSERLRLFDRARECYQTIVDNAKPSTGDGPRRQEMVDLFEMADWRLKHLTWEQATDRQLTAVFTSKNDQPSALPASPHDTNGSPPKPSGLVR